MNYKLEIENIVKSLEKRGFKRSEIEEGVHRSPNWIDQVLARGGNAKAFNLLNEFSKTAIAKGNNNVPRITSEPGQNSILQEPEPAFNRQAYYEKKFIEQLEKENDRLFRLLETNLTGISMTATTTLAYQKAWVDYIADYHAQGDPKKKDAIMMKMGKLVAGALGLPDKMDSPVDVGK